MLSYPEPPFVPPFLPILPFLPFDLVLILNHFSHTKSNGTYLFQKKEKKRKCKNTVTMRDI